MSDDKIVLVYIGNGSSLIGVPAMDLTAAMVMESGLTSDALVASGLYAKAKSNKPAPESHKAELGGSENK